MIKKFVLNDFSHSSLENSPNTFRKMKDLDNLTLEFEDGNFSDSDICFSSNNIKETKRKKKFNFLQKFKTENQSYSPNAKNKSEKKLTRKLSSDFFRIKLFHPKSPNKPTSADSSPKGSFKLSPEVFLRRKLRSFKSLPHKSGSDGLSFPVIRKQEKRKSDGNSQPELPRVLGVTEKTRPIFYPDFDNGDFTFHLLSLGNSAERDSNASVYDNVGNSCECHRDNEINDQENHELSGEDEFGWNNEVC